MQGGKVVNPQPTVVFGFRWGGASWNALVFEPCQVEATQGRCGKKATLNPTPLAVRRGLGLWGV